jgi:hypothetical protein
MTIAVCCLTPEGAVLGADSTSSFTSPNGFHYLNFNQKLFEIGETSTLAALTWGLGGLPGTSWRTLLAQLSDGLKTNGATDVEEVATRWIDLVWPIYTGQLINSIQRLKDLRAQPTRTPAEDEEMKTQKRGLVVGFCIVGRIGASRETKAYAMVLDPLAGKPAADEQKAMISWWGAPNPFMRLMKGADEELKAEILNSGKWTGSPADLNAVCQKHEVRLPVLPIRDAVDLVHACIGSTIKAMKFSDFPQICGGPIEIAVITTDRCFRWVRHKVWDAAILEA